jgi:hypothetical protein
MISKISRLGGLVVVLVLLAASAARADGRVYVHAGPPAPVVVAPVPSPAAGYVWQTGHYVWAGGAYVWRPGVWVRPPYRGAVWVPARWAHERRGWYYVPGAWRRH